MSQTLLFDQIEEAAAAIRALWIGSPRVGIILGTGLGGLVEKIEIAATLDYESIPNFPKSTATSHRRDVRSRAKEPRR